MSLTKSAIEKLKQHHIKEARFEFSQAVKLLEKSEVGHFSEFELDEARFGKVLTSYYLGNYDDTISGAMDCLHEFRHRKLVLSHLSTLQLLVELYLELEKHDLAYSFIDEAIEVLSCNDIPKMRLPFKFYKIIVLARQRFAEKAEQILGDVEKEFSEDIDFYSPDGLAETKAELALAKQKTEDAQAFFEQAIQLNTDCIYNKMMYYHRASLIPNLPQPKAETYHMRAIELAKKLQLATRESIFRNKFSELQIKPHPVVIDVQPPLCDQIQIFGFGMYQIQLPGQPFPLTKSDWKSGKARRLLLYLLLHPQPRRTKEKIADAIWPESDVKSLSNNFHATISNIRRVFNRPDLIHHHDGYYNVDTSNLLVDWYEFEKEIKQASEAKRQARIEVALSSFERARALYKGSFVPEFEDDWVDESRDYFERLYNNGNQDMATLLEEEREFQQALGIVDEMLKINPFDDWAYEKAIKLSGLLENYALAKDYYEHYKQMAREEFNSLPSPAIERTYKEYVLNI
ncbi:response regulator receiver and SARP domain protein [Chloroherpeton thalassium ATCC 35110]|uniref:Response regulator receiver and SARP domain protein n=1 Tax=Chloroherpeton thalassium (strain ATCC 35110 / GB-78) TaxID=517418 RepID=B3QYK6_CHLT3|nr:BTAD domain-containing putative transcriptional regulator [Chloroherpeton thalassium]ACF13634.1 response regulator receiver and SARP domain protein [Chloroherpeton thalassium ATCC 35110]